MTPQSRGELRFQVCNALVLLLQAHLSQLGLKEPVLLLLLQPSNLFLALLHLQGTDGERRGVESELVGGGLSDGLGKSKSGSISEDVGKQFVIKQSFVQKNRHFF